MRLWLVHQHAIPPSRSGGTRHWSVARALVGRGHDVLLISSGHHYQSHDDPTEYNGDGELLADEAGVRFLWLRTVAHRGNSVRRMLNVLSFWQAVGRSPTLSRLAPPDLVLGSSPQPMSALAALGLARRHGVPFVYEVRDLWPQTLLDLGHFGRWHPVIQLFGWVERRCARAARRIVTLLPASAGYLASVGADPARVVCIPNGTDLELVGAPSAAPVRIGGRPLFLYAGAMGIANGLEAVVRAAARVAERMGSHAPTVRFLGDGAETGRLRAMAAALGAVNVEFRPAVPKALVFGEMAEAEVFIMSLANSPVFRWGISPNKLFDYMAMGRPVLFAVAAANDPVQEAGAGISTPPGDHVAIAEAMEQLAGMTPEARRVMGARGRAYVEARHDIRRIAEHYADLLEEISGG